MHPSLKCSRILKRTTPQLRRMATYVSSIGLYRPKISIGQRDSSSVCTMHQILLPSFLSFLDVSLSRRLLSTSSLALTYKKREQETRSMTAIGQHNHKANLQKEKRNSRCPHATVDNGRKIPDATEGSKTPFQDQCVICSSTARTLKKPHNHICSLSEMFHDTMFRLQTILSLVSLSSRTHNKESYSNFSGAWNLNQNTPASPLMLQIFSNTKSKPLFTDMNIW